MKLVDLCLLPKFFSIQFLQFEIIQYKLLKAMRTNYFTKLQGRCQRP